MAHDAPGRPRTGSVVQTATRPRRVLGYARVSSEEQARGSSLQDQQDAIRAYAKARGLTVHKLYVEAESAVSEKIERREQIQALCADVREGDLVLCHRLDRWSRDPEYTYGSVRKILAARASFYAVDDACDPSTPEGDTALGFRVLFAREEHKRIKQRMVGTRQILRDKGYYVEGLPPFGYRRQSGARDRAERNVLIVEPKEAETVRAMFAACIAGKSIAKIAAELEVNRDLVVNTLHRRLFTGEIQDSRGEWIKGKHPAVVDADTFARAAAALAARRLGGARARGEPSETSAWLLRDVAHCARCNARMSAAYAGPHDARRYYYKCSKRCTSSYVPVRIVEAAMGSLVVRRLGELREELAKGDEPKPVPKVDCSEQRAKLARKRERYLEAFADGHTSRVELAAALARLDAERLKLDAKEGASKASSVLADARVRRETLASVGTMAKVWKLATGEERRQIVNLLASSVGIEAGAEPQPAWFSREDFARAYA